MPPPQNDYYEAVELVKKMGSKRGFDPIPPDRHAWAMAKGHPPLFRLWSAMCHCTIHWGHREEYAVDKEGNALNLQNLADMLGMDEANARKYWDLGVAHGVWRNGTKAEGARRLYLLGNVALLEGEETANEKVCTNLFPGFPPYQCEAIKSLEGHRQFMFLEEHAKLTLRGKALVAELTAVAREVIRREQDALYTAYGIPKIREVHQRKPVDEADAAEQLREVQARQARAARLTPAVEQFVLTFQQTEQTADHKCPANECVATGKCLSC